MEMKEVRLLFKTCQFTNLINTISNNSYLLNEYRRIDFYENRFEYEYPEFTFFNANSIKWGKRNDAYFNRNFKMKWRADFYVIHH